MASARHPAGGGAGLTGDTILPMAEISIRDLRNHGGEVIDRVTLGEELTITRDGKPVAQLRPLDKPPLSVTALLRRWARLPPMDPDALRRDMDASIDPSL
jgi:prevent-host-death family protein